MRRSGPGWFAVLPLLAVVSCANVWDFQTLTEGLDASSPAVDDGDVSGRDDRDAARDARVGPDGDAAIVIRDAESDAMILCRSLCTSGCCDSTGSCLAGTATGVCGANGAACVNCAGG